jgi:hypothetical protein
VDRSIGHSEDPGFSDVLFPFWCCCCDTSESLVGSLYCGLLMYYLLQPGASVAHVVVVIS